MNKKIAAFGAVLGMTAIILGAFGAHALKKYLNIEQLSTFETGVKYQMYHALFLLLVGTTNLVSDVSKKRIFYLVLVGIVLFSGSIYALSTMSITNIDFKAIGLATPIGGALLIGAWIVLFFQILQKKA
jgi:uncharacterized membrane protein YgdD (TMEM256/DUF423 family)